MASGHSTTTSNVTSVTSLRREPAVDRSEHQRLLRICYSVHPPIARAGQGNCEVYKLRALRCSQESIKGAPAFNSAVIMTGQRDACQPKLDRGMGDSKCGVRLLLQLWGNYLFCIVYIVILALNSKYRRYCSLNCTHGNE